MSRDKFAGEAGARVDFGREHGGFAGQKKHVVESKTFGNRTVNHYNLVSED